MAEVDLVNRDPNNINDHLQICFEDVLAEPEGARSIDCVWKNSYFCFNCCKSCCYKCYTFLCGICIAMEWGMEFACLAINHVWCITPQYKLMQINCNAFKKFYGLCIHCCLDPLCEACGLMFHAFKKS